MEQSESRKGIFATTMWSTVLSAQAGTETSRFEALERLAGRYRRPIIQFIMQSQRCGELEAEEMAHEFFAHWIRKDLLRTVGPEKGKFRTFIKRCVGNFLIDLARKRQALSNNPAQGLVSLDETNGEGMPLVQPLEGGMDAGSQLDLCWARELLSTSLSQLERECLESKRGRLFEALKPSLCHDADALPHVETAKLLGTSEGAIKVAAHRLKQRLGEIIREEVQQTVGEGEDWEDELRYLIQLLGGQA